MSTIAPTAEREIAARMRAKGANISTRQSPEGTGAIEGTLTIMVGGAVAAFDRARPLLEALGKRITYMGESGAGQVTKLANQIAVALSLKRPLRRYCSREKAVSIPRVCSTPSARGLPLPGSSTISAPKSSRAITGQASSSS